MITPTQSLRNRLSEAVSQALKNLPQVMAGWEGGSAAFGALDDYSDIDLNFLVDDEASLEDLYAVAERSLNTVSPVVARQDAPPGRYFKLEASGEFLLIDLCFIRVGAADHLLDVERHGSIVRLFDKGDWLHPRSLDEAGVAAKRERRYRELRGWFSVSQSFVRKAILRRQHAEAIACFWGYTIKPLMEVLRMRYCPNRWDFGIRYLERDLPLDVSAKFQELVFVRDLEELRIKLSQAETWGIELLRELDSHLKA